MVRNSVFKFIFFTLLIQLTTPCLLLGIDIELFSILYTDKDDLKVSILYNLVYDEEARQKELLRIKKLEEETIINQQKKQAVEQKILENQQKKIEIEQELKEKDEIIRKQKIALQKILSEL
jgi:hypothetical protein